MSHPAPDEEVPNMKPEANREQERSEDLRLEPVVIVPGVGSAEAVETRFIPSSPRVTSERVAAEHGDSPSSLSNAARSKTDVETLGNRAKSADPALRFENLPAEFGRYRLEKRLGQGGMGTVYLALDSQLDRQVALKVPRLASDDGPEVMIRFTREAKLAATLFHPNICPVFDVGAIDGVHYMTMGYIEGKQLAEMLKDPTPQPQARVATLVRSLARALAEAHQLGIIHRDLKPGNIMINQRGQPMIMDFGLARRDNPNDIHITSTGQMLGTPAYMSPEQVAGDVSAMGAGCDIYGLGVILYELLCGRPPFKGTVGVVLSKILTEPIPPPSQIRQGIDPRLQAICLKATAKRIEDRFASMHAFAEALTDYLNLERDPSLPAAAEPTHSSAPTPSFVAASRTLSRTTPQGKAVEEQKSSPKALTDTQRQSTLQTGQIPKMMEGWKTEPSVKPRSWLWFLAVSVFASVTLGAILLFFTPLGDQLRKHNAPIQSTGEAGVDEPVAAKSIRPEAIAPEVKPPLIIEPVKKAPVAEVPVKKDPIKIKPPPKPRLAPLGNKYAILLGVSKYETSTLRNLPYGEVDMWDLSEAMRNSGYYSEHVVLLTQAQGAHSVRLLPTAPHFRRELRLLLKNRTSHDSVVVALAGHVVAYQGDQDRYICPSGADLADKDTLISLNEIYTELDSCRAGCKILLADTGREPFTQGNDKSRRELRLHSSAGLHDIRPPDGIAAFFGCSAEEHSNDSHRLQHGVFFHAVARSLHDGLDVARDRPFTMPMFVSDVTDRVAAIVTAEHSARQTPLRLGATRETVSLVRAKPSLGCSFQTVDDGIARRLKLKERSGVLILGVLPGGAAENCGLKVGDIVLKMQGESTATIKEVLARLRQYEVGSGITIDFQRDGTMHRVTAVLPQSPTEIESARAYRKMAEKGESWAQYSLGSCYSLGIGGPLITEQALDWWRRAALQGHVSAQYQLGMQLAYGSGVTRDFEGAVGWFRQAAAQELPQAQYRLGVMLANGTGVGKDDGEAVEWYRKAANQGYPPAQFSLGWMYQNGLGIGKDDNEAARWYRKAAEQDDASAQNNLAAAFAAGRGIAENDAEAVTWYRKAAEQEYSLAQNNLGLMYVSGKGVQRDLVQGVRWYRKAADQGSAFAQNNLAAAYALGTGVLKDDSRAARWYRRSAEQGNSIACYKMGLICLNGLGAPTNEVAAFGWFRKAAEQKYPPAEDQLGWMYLSGKGVSKDVVEAAKWYRRAAENSNVTGQYNLGMMYESGQGVAKDVKEALVWYRKAAARGDARALAAIKRLEGAPLVPDSPPPKPRRSAPPRPRPTPG